MFKIGDVLVVNTNAPARFKNLRPGSLWKCVKLLPGGAIVVADGSHKGITTQPSYFLKVPTFVLDNALSVSVRTDLQVRFEALEDVGPETQPGGEGLVTYKVAGAVYEVPTNVARALAARNSGKLIQKQLARALGGF